VAADRRLRELHRLRLALFAHQRHWRRTAGDHTYRSPTDNASQETTFVQTFCPHSRLPARCRSNCCPAGGRRTAWHLHLTGLGGLDKTYSYGITDIAKYDLNDDITLKNIFGYRVLKNLLRYDLEGTPFPVIDFTTPNGWNLSNSQYTDEVQFQGKSLGGNLNWIAGAFGEFLHPGGYTVAQLNTTSVIAHMQLGSR